MNEIEVLNDQIKSLQAALIAKEEIHRIKIAELMELKLSSDRKQLLIRYKIDEKGCVYFIDPLCDEIPVRLFGNIMEAISNVEQEWNTRRENKLSV